MGAFSGTDLTFVEIPNSITSIGDEVFSECTRLASVIIPNSVTSIGEQSFAWTGLTSVEIPNSITYIGEEAFAECDSLKIVNYNAMNPVKAEKSIFSDKTYSDATLNIAEGALDAIKSTSPWKYFNNIQDKLSGLETVVDDIDSNLPKAVYDLRGIKVSETTEGLPAGIYIIRQGGKSKKVTID